jgi:hypothetical protein
MKTRMWAMVIATVLILGVVVLALASIFQPGPVSEWKIKIDEIEVSGSNLLLAFAILITLILQTIWPDFRRAIFDTARATASLATDFISLIRGLFTRR